MLTQNGAGDINASFVNTETMQQCQQKALMLEGVFTASQIPVVENRCIQSDLIFSKFDHASASSKVRNFYLIKFMHDDVLVELMPGWKLCMAKARTGVAQGNIYCSSSVQILEKNIRTE